MEFLAADLAQGDFEALRELARTAARKVLSRDKADLPIDPRNAIFASEYIRECDRLLAHTPALLQEAIESAGHAAEGTNVDPYQGVVEVLQNAEDRRAREVRVMFRDRGAARQMLIVHNGQPVEYEHILAMMLPFVSTKRDDTELRGRFGIGLKTLRRICTDIEVHGSPYHFGSGEGVSIIERPAEDAIADFYHPATDTLLVLELEADFDATAFGNWFEAWTDDGLIFLDDVRHFELVRDYGGSVVRSIKATAWNDLPVQGDELSHLQRRTVTAGARRYLVHRGFVKVPEGHQRFHKRTGTTTAISVATASTEEEAGIFVGFRTRIPTALPFAIDAQFDPIASREGIQENKWNEWLLGQVGTVLAHAAASALSITPRSAWSLVPVAGEGVKDERWPATVLAAAFDAARKSFNELARFGPAGNRTLAEIAYEDQLLNDLLTEDDVAALAPDKCPLARELRDKRQRWRKVVDALAISRKISPVDVISGMSSGVFAIKDSTWWVEAVVTLTAGCEPGQIFSARIWLSDDGTLVTAEPRDATDRKLVFGSTLPPLSQRHRLFDVLHSEFGSAKGRVAIDWLGKHAAFKTHIEAEDELLAFAAAFEEDPIRLSPEELRELRDLLDPLSIRQAEKIGERLGRAALIEAVEAETKGKRSWRLPTEVYLPKAIDKDTPHWPNAASGIAGIFWAHPAYDEGLRTGLGKRRKRADGSRSRGARNFLTLLGVATGMRLTKGQDRGERSENRLASMQSQSATKLSYDICSEDLDRVLRPITNKRLPKKERKERALALLRSLSRDWSRGLQDQASVPGEHTARVHTYTRGTHDALWLDRLKEAEWIPVGRDRFRRPSEAAVRTAETQAIYKAEDFVAGIGANDLDEDFLGALGLTARVRVSDLLTMLEDMRDGREAFDENRVELAYQYFARLIGSATWLPEIGDTPINDFRNRFAARRGLVLVVNGKDEYDWRRPDQVRRGKAVIPDAGLYAAFERFSPLWKVLGIKETSVEDCCGYLKTHAERSDSSADQGVVIQVYRYMSGMLATRDDVPSSCRYIPLACHGGWWARRPIYSVADAVLRDRLADALPEHRFWCPPCDTRSIEHLVNALSVHLISPDVRPLPDRRAEESGEDLVSTFQAAVDHLSNTLGKADAKLRQALTVSWDALRAAKLFVYDGDVPVDVMVAQLGMTIQTQIPAHIRLDPLEFHLSRDALELREHAGAAVASLFESSTVYPFDGEWALAWQAASREVAKALQFSVDDAAHKAKVEATADRIARREKGSVKLTRRDPKNSSSSNSPPPPPRELKDFQSGISSVEIVEGTPAKSAKSPVNTTLKRRPSPSRSSSEQRVANTNYTNGQLEDFGWEVLMHVLDRADGTELEDFRRRHGVGADGAFDWTEFVELKAAGRSMQTSVSFTPAEFKRALERGNDYILALVYNCEKGLNTTVKLIFDPVRRASLRETEGVRLNNLPEASGIIVELGEDGALSNLDEEKTEAS